MPKRSKTEEQLFSDLQGATTTLLTSLGMKRKESLSKKNGGFFSPKKSQPKLPSDIMKRIQTVTKKMEALYVQLESIEMPFDLNIYTSMKLYSQIDLHSQKLKASYETLMTACSHLTAACKQSLGQGIASTFFNEYRVYLDTASQSVSKLFLEKFGNVMSPLFQKILLQAFVPVTHSYQTPSDVNEIFHFKEKLKTLLETRRLALFKSLLSDLPLGHSDSTLQKTKTTTLTNTS